MNKASSSNETKKRFWQIVSISQILASLSCNVQYKIILAMIFNEIKCHVNTSLGLVGGCISCIPPVSAPGDTTSYFHWKNPGAPVNDLLVL